MLIIDNPLLRLSRVHQEGHATGTQDLHRGDQQINVHFFDGLIEAVHSNIPEFRLGQMMVKSGLIDASRMERAMSRSKGMLTGEMLLEEEKIQFPQLERVLITQAVELFLLAVSEGFEIGSFYKRRGPKSKYPLHFPVEQIELEIARYNISPLEPAQDSIVYLKKDFNRSLPWNPEEIAVLSCLDGPRKLEELASLSAVPLEKVKTVISILMNIGIVESHRKGTPIPEDFPPGEFEPIRDIVPRMRQAFSIEELIEVEFSSNLIGEQARVLKIQLKQSEQQKPLSIINVTSPEIGDGKSLVSCILALNLAKDPEKRILLIDGDLRGSSVHSKFGLTIGPGLYQSANSKLPPHCFMRRIGDLYVMTAGDYTDDAVEVLSLDRMSEILNLLRQDFDTVIIDSPPILPVADARLLSTMVDGTILVVYQGKTAFGNIVRSIELLQNANPLGIVLNGVKTTLLTETLSEYGYGSGYGYGYGKYGYGSTYSKENQMKKRGHKKVTNKSRRLFAPRGEDIK